MTDNLISRDELLKAIDTWDKFGYSARYGLERLDKDDKGYVPYIHYDDVIKCIKGMSSVNPQESKIGHWIKGDINEGIYCSECNENALTDYDFHYIRSNFCPNCGARIIEPQESEDKCKNCKYYSNPDYERCHKCKAESEVSDADSN